MNSSKYSRRAVLKRLGIGAGFLPLLNAERSLAANASGFPTRFIAITFTNGIVPPNFYPAGAAGPLPATLPPILQPLAAWSSKMLVMRNAKTQTSPIDITSMLDAKNTYGGHSAYPAVLTGYNAGGGPSIDTLIANNLSSTAGITNAQLNVGCRPGNSTTSYRSAGAKNQAQTDPYKLFNSLFAGVSMPPAQVNTLFQRRKSILDSVASELTTFASNLGTDDKANIQIHLDSVRQLESQLQSTGTTSASCTAPSITPTGLTFSSNNNYPSQVTFMADIVAAAVICGKARAVTMDLIDDGGGNSLTFPFLNINSPDYHAIAHQGSSGYANKTIIDTWFYKQCVAEVVGKLAAAPEGAGSVLDNTVVLVANDMNEGSNHYVGAIPYLIIGSGGGFFKTGRMVTFPSQQPNNKLLTSILHAMGMMVTGVGATQYSGDLDSTLTV